MLKYSILVLFLVIAAIAQGPPPAQPTQLVSSRLWILPETPAPQQIPSANVQISGARGQTTYFYWIVSRYLVGNSIPAGPFAITNAPNTLNGSNFNVIFWQAVSDAGITYDVLRTSTPVMPSSACGCAVATNVTAPVNDQSNSLGAYTVANLDPNTLNFTLTNEVQGGGSTHLILRQNGLVVSDLSVVGGCPQGTCVVNAPTADQIITGAHSLFLSDPGATLGIGTSTTLNPGAVFIETHANSNSNGIDLYAHTTANPIFRSATINFFKSRNTQASPQAVQLNDTLMKLDAGGFDGTAYTLDAAGTAEISAAATENWTNAAHGTAIKIYSVRTGSIATTGLFLRLGGTGNVYPAIAVDTLGSAAHFRLADDSGDAPISAASFQSPPGAFANLLTCNAGAEGMTRAVNDSTTNVWGATITGGGANHVLGYCDGTNWTVAAK